MTFLFNIKYFFLFINKIPDKKCVSVFNFCYPIILIILELYIYFFFILYRLNYINFLKKI